MKEIGEGPFIDGIGEKESKVGLFFGTLLKYLVALSKGKAEGLMLMRDPSRRILVA